MRRFLAWPALLVVLLTGMGLAIFGRLQVLEIGDQGLRLRVKEGEIVVLLYTQSMYGVRVAEKMQVRHDRLVLCEVDSTRAALDYLGIEKTGPGNVDRVLREFSVPRASVGGQVLMVGDKQIVLKTVAGREANVRIRLTREAVWQYIFRTVL